MCSTQLEFEWTIDEVSSLNPANVEAHETQFVSIIDPEVEAKAQAAISTYFKERIIGKCFVVVFVATNNSKVKFIRKSKKIGVLFLFWSHPQFLVQMTVHCVSRKLF